MAKGPDINDTDKANSANSFSVGGVAQVSPLILRTPEATLTGGGTATAFFRRDEYAKGAMPERFYQMGMAEQLLTGLGVEQARAVGRWLAGHHAVVALASHVSPVIRLGVAGALVIRRNTFPAIAYNWLLFSGAGPKTMLTVTGTTLEVSIPPRPIADVQQDNDTFTNHTKYLITKADVAGNFGRGQINTAAIRHQSIVRVVRIERGQFLRISHQSRRDVVNNAPDI